MELFCKRIRFVSKNTKREVMKLSVACRLRVIYCRYYLRVEEMCSLGQALSVFLVGGVGGREPIDTYNTKKETKWNCLLFSYIINYNVPSFLPPTHPKHTESLSQARTCGLHSSV